MRKIYLLGGKGDAGESTDAVQEFNIKDIQTFKADWNLPKPLSAFALCKDSPSSAIIAGGATLKDSSTKQVYRISTGTEMGDEHIHLGKDLATDTIFRCAQLADMNHPRSNFTLTYRQLTINDFELYAIGGNPNCLIEKYSSKHNHWQDIITQHSTPFSSLQGHQSILLPDGNIYILGGMTNKDQYSNQLTIFNTETNQINDANIPMNQARAHFQAVLSHDLQFIYAIGGLSSNGTALSSVEKFDTLRQVWLLVAPMNEKRGRFGACSILK